MITARQRSCGKVMFSHVSVILSMGARACVAPRMPLPATHTTPPPPTVIRLAKGWHTSSWNAVLFHRSLSDILVRGSHVTTTHDALNLTIQGPPPKNPSPPGHVQTCSTWTSMYREPPLPKYVQTCSLWSMYSWQVTGWHPTGMLVNLSGWH